MFYATKKRKIPFAKMKKGRKKLNTTIVNISNTLGKPSSKRGHHNVQNEPLKFFEDGEIIIDRKEDPFRVIS